MFIKANSKLRFPDITKENSHSICPPYSVVTGLKDHPCIVLSSGMLYSRCSINHHSNPYLYDLKMHILQKI